jgi:hypothetical protein
VCCHRGDKLEFLNIFSANKVAILFSVDLFYFVYYIVFLELFRWRKASNNFRKGRMFVTPPRDNIHMQKFSSTSQLLRYMDQAAVDIQGNSRYLFPES